MMKTKKLMSIILALAMLCTMFGNLTAFALPNTESFATKISAVKDSAGNTVKGVEIKWTAGDDTGEWIADGTSKILVTCSQDVSVTLEVTKVPQGYKSVDSVTFAYQSVETDLANTAFEVESDGTSSRIVDLKLVLEEDTEMVDLKVNFVLNDGITASDVNELNFELVMNTEDFTSYEKVDGVKYTLTFEDEALNKTDYQNRPIYVTDGDRLNLGYVGDKKATITITEVPAGYKNPGSCTFTFKENGNTLDGDNSKFVRRSTNGTTYGIVVKLEKVEFTVKAAVNSATTDIDTTKDGVQVNAKDTVKVDVVVSGENFTTADWEMIYDPTLFKYVSTTTNVNTSKSTVKLDDIKTAVLSGKLIANAGITAGDEFKDGTAIVTYEFEALSQNADKVGTFKIESAHANNYVIAGTEDNKIANTKNATVEIVLVDNTEDKDEENGIVTVPAGKFTAAEKVYNAQKQTGNAFDLDEEFKNAKVTYFANEDGSAVEESELATKSFKTTLPSWKNVGTYTYYAKIYGDGLKTTYVSTTLTIKKATIVPSATFKVYPDVKEVEFTPTLEGVLDGTHAGTVTVEYTDINGKQTKTLNASDFAYDGETTSVYKEAIKSTAATSGDFEVKLTYTDGDADNYTGTTNTASVDVDKITADEETVKALEETITSVFGYDSTAHSLEIDDDAIAAITNGTWSYTVSDTTASVTNVGDDALVKVTFTDTTGNYNDVIVYAILKVTPANVKITVDDKTKVMNDVDPELTGTIKVVDEDGNAVEGMDANKLYGTDDLEVSYEREAGEEVGTYNITASYAPSDNYTVEVVDGTFTITEPEIDPENPEDAVVKVEVVDLSKGGTNGDITPDYTADKRLILVYTDVDKLFYGYKVDEDTTEKMFDVTAAGYKYVDNNYTNGTYTEDAHEYKHIYGIVVDAIDTYAATEEYEKQYRDNVVFLSSNLSDAPENIVYDGDINLSNKIDVNDYSMTNGIYNNQYARATFIKNILKADINGDKKVDTTDVLNVKTIYDAKNK